MNETRSPLCAVRRAADGDGADPFLTVEFAHPDRWTTWPDRLGPDHAYYRVGLYGEAGPAGGTIAFRCGTGPSRSGFPVVAATLELHGEEKASAHLLMPILHATARAMSQKLDCGQESALPPTLPRPSPPSDYRRPPLLRAAASEQPVE